jgi:hypothetical protein
MPEKYGNKNLLSEKLAAILHNFVVFILEMCLTVVF